LVASPIVKILITGATGFVGGHVVEQCLAGGDELHALTLPEGDRPLPPAVTTHPLPLLDPDVTTELVHDVAPEVVIHLAGEASVGRSFGQPAATWDVNTWGTLSVLEALRRSESQARALIVTSGEIYGRVALDELPVDIGTALEPLSPYAASKAAADLMAGQYAENYGLGIIRVRPFNQIGPGQDARFVVPSIAKQIVEAERAGHADVVLSVGNVSTRRDFTDVRDAARAYRLIAEHGHRGAVYHLCTGRSLAVREIIDALADAARIPVTITSDPEIQRAGEQPDLYGTPELLTQHTGWSPDRDLEETVTDTLDWWREQLSSTG